MLGNLDYFNPTTGLDVTMQALYTGQQRREAAEKALSDLQTAQQNRQLEADKARRDAELHPYRVKEAELNNEGRVLTNKKTSADIDHNERTRQLETVDKFFKAFQDYNDPEIAFAVSGAPRTGKFMEFAQMPQEARNKVIEQWTIARNRDTAYKERIKADENIREIEARGKETRQTALQVEAERTRRAMGLAQLKLTQAQNAQRNKNYQQAATHYFEGAQAALEAGNLREAQRLQQLAQQMADLDYAARTAPKPQAPGGVDLSKLTGGEIPTVPPVGAPTIQLPGTQPNNPNSPRKPPTVSNWGPPSK